MYSNGVFKPIRIIVPTTGSGTVTLTLTKKKVIHSTVCTKFISRLSILKLKIWKRELMNTSCGPRCDYGNED